MKKLFFITAAACVTLASCVKNEPVQTADFGESIAFDDPIMSPNTKVGVAEKSTFVQNDNFKVNVWYTADDAFATSKTYVDAPFVVTKGATDWTYEGAYYWPKSGYLHFSAFSPASVNGGFGEGGVLFTDYTVSTTVTSQVDLLYSDIKTTSYEKPVQMLFNHALSAVNFKVTKGSAAPAFVLTGISLAGINSVGSFDQAESPMWTTNTAVAYSVDVPSEFSLGATSLYAHNKQESAGSQAALMLLPQSVAGKVVTISYTMDGIPQTSTYTLSGEWEPGYRYTYAISFSVEKIEFTASVEPWEDGSATGALN